jgi:calpain-15
MEVESTEIHPGIIVLLKTLSPVQKVVEVQNNKPNELEITANLANSRGAKITETGSLERTVRVAAHSSALLATIELSGEWTLRHTFSFKCLPPAREQAQGMTETVLAESLKKAKLFLGVLANTEINSLTLKEVRKKGAHFVDPYFPPGDSSVFLGTHENHLDTAIHWRRPSEFMSGVYNVFKGDIEPTDIRQGKLGDAWFISALVTLAERPELVRRLFLIDEANAEGLYRVRLCKDGEWVTVTLDDYFPCYPSAGLLFSRSQDNQMWVMLLEKAYAKLHGSYMLLRRGRTVEALSDLTGCPAETIELESDEVRLSAQDKLWPYLINCDLKGALMSASTPGEDRWKEAAHHRGELVPGHAYTLISVKQVHGHRLLNIRNSWGVFDWTGDWGVTSPLWTSKMKAALSPNLGENDGTFWMSFDDFLRHFSRVNICHVSSYQEARMKGLFKKVVVNNRLRVTSQWYYSVTASSTAEVYIGLHQNDKRTYGVADKQSYVDLGLVVIEQHSDGRLELVHYEESVSSRQTQAKVTLEAGHSYIILPRTTGCAMQRPAGVQVNTISLMHGEELNPLFRSTLVDLFRKANVMLGEDLSPHEFTSLFAEVDYSMSEAKVTEIFQKYVSSAVGITLDGFLHYMHDLTREVGEERLYEWLTAWGYDRDLMSVGSKHFILTLHSDEALKVLMHKVKSPVLSQKTDELVLMTHGVRKARIGSLDLYCLYEPKANAFTYGVFNTGPRDVNCEFDCSLSTEVGFGIGTEKSRHSVKADSWEMLNFIQISNDSANCRIRPQLRVVS